MGTELGGDIKCILDIHYCSLLTDVQNAGLSALQFFHFWALVRPERTAFDPSSQAFAVNLICDNAGRYVLSDIQMNGSFTAELSIVAGFISPVSGFKVAPSPGPKRRHLFLPACSYCPAFALRRSRSRVKNPFRSSLLRLPLHQESLRTSAEGNGRFPLISSLLQRSKVVLQIYNGVTEPRRLKTGRDNLFWGGG